LHSSVPPKILPENIDEICAAFPAGHDNPNGLLLTVEKNSCLQVFVDSGITYYYEMPGQANFKAAFQEMAG
jgi:hypothetical protein